MESVSFKVYLEKEDGSGSEIRRFCVDESSAGTFDAVKLKIRQLYPSLQNAEFNIFWKDNENDKIAVNSDAEYIVAITTIREEVQDNIVRLYCTLAADSGNNHASAEEEEEEAKKALLERIRYTREQLNALNPAPRLLPVETSVAASCEAATAGGEPVTAARVTFAPGTLKGLECDVCRQNLDGRLLFKCVTCPDYDLCDKCVKHAHLEHVMIRIPSQQALVRSGIFKVDRLNKLARRHSHTSRFDFSALIVPLADNFNAKHFRKMRDTVEAGPICGTIPIRELGQSYSSAATESAPRFTFLCPVSRKLAKKMAKGGLKAFPAQPDCQTLGRSASFAFADECKNKGGEERKSKHGADSKKEKKEEKEPGVKRSRSFREGGAAVKSALDYWLPPALTGTPADDVIKGVVDLLAGVNLSGPNEEKQEDQPTSAAASTEPEEAKKRKVPTPPAPTAAQVMRELNDIFFNRPQTQANEPTIQQANNPDSTTTDKKEPSQQPTSSTATPPAPPVRQLSNDDNDGIRVMGANDGIRVIGISPSSPSSEHEEFVFVDPSAQGAIPRRAPQQQQSPSIYPSPSEIPPAQQESAPPSEAVQGGTPPSTGGQGRPNEKQERLSAALNKMLAMGFTNEGGWLENLLNNHDASIERVLEILLPSSVFGRVID